MADYNSIFSGPQIDDAITKVRGIASDPSNIDDTVAKMSDITVTATQINDNINLVNGVTVTADEINHTVHTVAEYTNTPAEIDRQVDRMETLMSLNENIDRTVAIMTIDPESAEPYSVLTLNNSKTPTWMSRDITSLYNHLVSIRDPAQKMYIVFNLIVRIGNNISSIIPNVLYNFVNAKTVNSAYTANGTCNISTNDRQILGLYSPNGTDLYAVHMMDNGLYSSTKLTLTNATKTDTLTPIILQG